MGRSFGAAAMKDNSVCPLKTIVRPQQPHSANIRYSRHLTQPLQPAARKGVPSRQTLRAIRDANRSAVH
jgi:hypothetical protein